MSDDSGGPGNGRDVSSNSRLFAFLAYFLGLIGFIIVLLAKKDDEFALYHAKQSLVLTIGSFAISAISQVVTLIAVGSFVPRIDPFNSSVSPLLILTAPSIILLIPSLGILILYVIGIINAVTGEKNPLPFIGRYAEKINL